MNIAHQRAAYATRARKRKKDVLGVCEREQDGCFDMHLKTLDKSYRTCRAGGCGGYPFDYGLVFLLLDDRVGPKVGDGAIQTGSVEQFQESQFLRKRRQKEKSVRQEK